MKELLDLFLTFARIGGFTFGGGYAMLPMLEKEVVEKRHWATGEQLIDYFAIGQCTPGIIAVNTATFIGQSVHGFWGAVFATAGMVTPSIVIIAVIAAFISGFQDYEIVQHAFAGIRAAVVALIVSSVLKISKKSVVDLATLLIFIAVTLLSVLTDLSPVIFVVAAAVCGLILRLSRERKGGKAK